VSDDQTLILFGATGDLCGRHLIPALARLFVADELPAGFRVLGTGPQPWDLATFHDHVRTRLTTFAPDLASTAVESFLGRLSYESVDVSDRAAVGGLVSTASDGGALTFYLALPTNLIAATVDGLRSRGLPGSARIAVEKPFGSDLRSAEELNDALARATSDESHVFRVDHFLGMPIVQGLPSAVARLRRDSIPSGSDIATVSILWEETLALEGRAAFYDRAGALKDLLQNHLVQVLCQVLLDDTPALPGSWSERRLQALRAVQLPTAERARTSTRRARYSAGVLHSTDDGATTEVPDYVAERGVDETRHTETFAQVSLHVDTPEWPDTEIVLRAGKAMGGPRRGIAFELRPSPGLPAGELWIDLETQPAAVEPDAHPAIESAPVEQLAYVNVLRDLLSGAYTLSVSREETELAWRIFTPVLEEWAAGTVPLETYPAGTTP
jgi:glucose-6-phosphate 1-dehydrogenase